MVAAYRGNGHYQSFLLLWPGVRPGGPKAQPRALTPGRGAAGAALEIY